MFVPNLLPYSLLIDPVSTLKLAPVMPLYLGPETIMPITSLLAALFGVILLFWRLILRAIKNVFAPIRGAGGVEEDPLTPVDIPEETKPEEPVA